MTEAAAEQVVPEPQPGKNNIGIWGAPQSGKTTFLAALRTAMTLQDTGWVLNGVNNGSTEFLASSTHQLTVERIFPSATTQLERLAWKLTGTKEVKERGKFGMPRRTTVPAHVYLDFVDPPGRLFDTESPQQNEDGQSGGAGGGGPKFATGGPSSGPGKESGGGASREELVSHLANCGGLIYLLDPTREREASDSYQFFNRTVLEIGQRAVDNGRDQYLPQHLAVCVTKYDHYWVRSIAKKHGLESVADGERLFPSVHGELAEIFFEELCREDKVSNTDAMFREIKQRFSPERTRFFVTSAVGFYVDPATGRFDEDDYSNLVKSTGPNGTTSMQIKGKVYPINVLEPIMWLVDSLTKKP